MNTIENINNLELKHLDSNMKGIELGLESIDQLFKLKNSLECSNVVYVTDPIMKTVSITLENIVKLHKLNNIPNISLENNDSDSIFQKILQMIKDIWKKIVETFEYVWETITSFFDNSKPNSKKLNNKITDIKDKKLKPISDKLKSIDYKVNEEFEIKNEHLIGPLNYRNTQITSAVYFKEISDLDYLNSSINKLSLAVLDGYKDLERVVGSINNNSNINYETIYNSFFKHILEFGNLSKNVFKTGNLKDKLDILESLINYDTGSINTKDIFIVDGFINGGMFYVYSINATDQETLTECLAVSKINDSSKQSRLYYINPKDLDNFIKDLEELIENNVELEDNLNNRYKEIRLLYKSVKLNIDKMINDTNLTTKYEPDELKEKFDALRKVTQSSMKFVLDASKAYGMFSDSVIYFTKLSEANVDFYIGKLNKEQ